jgi:RimJ/RimL family protein N-acetyltransferase
VGEAFDSQPVLAGEGLLLRPLRAADIDPLFEIARDRALWAQHPVPERSEEAVFRDWMAAKLAAGGTLVAASEGQGLVGSSTYSNLREEDGGAIEIGSTFIARRLWGSPINQTMKRLMLTHALRHVARVEFLVGEGNLRSRRAVEKIGGVLTERIVVAEVNGRAIPHLVYEVDRASFAAGPLGGSSPLPC